MTAINVNRWLKDALAELTVDSNVQVVTKRPADLLARLPLVYARHVSGSGAHPRWSAYASITVDVYTDLRIDPFDLAKDVYDRLRTVQERQDVFDVGWCAHMEMTLPPWDNSDPLEASVVNRSTSEYRLLLRST